VLEDATGIDFGFFDLNPIDHTLLLGVKWWAPVLYVSAGVSGREMGQLEGID
jgi:hypothetical protein